MSEIFTLKGKKALVTGATRGIGKAIALKFADAGMDVVAVGRNKQRAEDAVEELSKRNVKASFILADISDDAECSRVADEAGQFLGGIDVLVNCAGILTSTPIEEISRKEWDDVLATNLTGCFFMIQKCIPYLKQSGAGRVINVSSNAGRMGGYANSQAYTASKGGMDAITFGIARQLAPFGITVNVVCPGTTATEMAGEYSADKIKQLTGRIPLGRLGKPEETAAAVCFLASDEAGFMTGAVLDVNGGMHMG